MKTSKTFTPSVALPLVALCLAIALLVGAAPPASMDPLQALPEGALFVASAGNPGRLMANALAFARKAGLNELENPLAEVLQALEGKGDLPEDLVDLASRVDWSRRLVLAVYAPDAEAGARPGLLAYIPAINPRTMQQAILQASEAAGQMASTSLALSGYVMVAMGMEAPADLNFKKAVIPILSAYPASSLATWVNVEAGKEYLGLLTEGLSSLFGSSGSGSDDYDWDEDLDQAWEEDLDWEEDLALEDGEAWAENEATEGEEVWDDEWDGDWDWDAEDWDTEEPEAADGIAEESETDEGYTENWGADDWSDSPDAGLADGWDGMGSLGSLGSMMDGAEGMLESLGEIFKDIRSVDFGLIVEADRIWVRTGTSAAPGGLLYRMTSDASSGQLPLPYLSYLETDALFSAAWSTKADWAIGMLEALYKTILPDEALLRKSLDAMKASMASTGPNGAMTFDLRLSDELASAIKEGSPSGDEAIPLLGRGLSFDVAGVMQLTDRQGFRDAMRQSMALIEDPDYLAILNEGQIEIQADRSIGIMDGMPYDRYEYAIRSTDEGSMAEDALDIFKAIAGPLLTPVYVYRGDKAYLGFGKPETLRALIGRDRAARPLQTAARFKALRGGAPADARGIMYLSTGTLMRRIMQVLPDEKSILPFGHGDLYGVLGWFSASPGHMGLGLGLGAEDIKAFRSIPD
jgi:hypothetical protein